MPDLNLIRLLILDVDGTLTDGRLYVDPSSGLEMRAFNVHDGFAIRGFIVTGGTVAICSGKGGGSIEHRARTLGIEHVVQSSRDKLGDCQALLDKLGLTWQQAAMMGDDVPDITVMRNCGWSAAPADARPEVLAAAAWTAPIGGGRGAVRAAIEHVMKAQGTWGAWLERFGAQSTDAPSQEA
jgi:3-deoxy-D-manno-octulosonate 8-phosphate phosphatase (KDO 8-P phosphatase)